jgi:glutathione S-transferase
MTLQFYMTPGSCSTGIHILLEELGLPFQVTIVNMPAGDHRRPDFLTLNPKGTIPTLVLHDGQALTEFQAIAYWLALSDPRRRLLAADPLQAARTLELMDHVVGTVLGQGYTRIFTTERYLPPDLAGAELVRWQQYIQARGRELVAEAFAVIEARLPDRGYAIGADFSVADAALFYVEFWADKTGLPLPARCAAHYQLVRTRPVVQRVLREEGYR